MAVRFDAAADRTSHTGSVPPPASGLTVTAWVYISVDRDDSSCFFRIYQSSFGTTATIETDTDGTTGPNYFTASGSVTNGKISMSVGTWYPIAIAVSGTGSNNASTYIRAAGTTTVGTGTVSTSTPAGICLGGRDVGDATEWLNGRLAHVRIWSSKLTQTQIEAEWTSTAPVVTSGLYASWWLPTSNDLSDRSGNSRGLGVNSGGSLTTEADPGALVGANPSSALAGISGLSAWYRGDGIEGLTDGTTFSSWVDSSGNGYSTEQISSGRYPSYETNEINSLPVARFKSVGDSTDRALRTIAPAATGSKTVFAVVRPTAVGATSDGVQRDIWCGDNGNLKLQVFEGKLRWLKIGGGLLLAGTTALATGTTYVVCGTFTSATSATIHLNGVQDATTTTTTTLTASTFTYLGGSGLFGGEPFFGDIAEVIVFDAALTSTDRGTVTSYLTTKYAVTGAAAAGRGPDARINRIRPLLVR